MTIAWPYEEISSQLGAMNMEAITAAWTAERIEALKACFEAGLSCREIALEIGVSRNAVIGKIFRLKLSRGGDQTYSERKGGPKLQRRVTQHRIMMALQPSRSRVKKCLYKTVTAVRCLNWESRNAAGRSVSRVTSPSGSVGISLLKDFLIALAMLA